MPRGAMRRGSDEIRHGHFGVEGELLLFYSLPYACCTD